MKAQLLVVIPFFKGDLDSARNLLAWMKELGDYKSQNVLLVADSGVPRDVMIAMYEECKKMFGSTEGMTVNVPPQRVGWPSACNFMFTTAAKFIWQNCRLPFLWLEPDCIPLKKDWLDLIAEEYGRTHKRFMGAVITQDKQPELPRQHLTGCAIYPNDAYELFNTMTNVLNGTQAWDIAGAPEVVPASKNSELFQSYWGTFDLAPVFVAKREANSPKNHIAFEFIRPAACLMHRDKTHSLIPLLRERIFGVTGVSSLSAPPSAVAVEGVATEELTPEQKALVNKVKTSDTKKQSRPKAPAAAAV